MRGQKSYEDCKHYLIAVEDGGNEELPVWMTDPCWKDARVIEQPYVSLLALKKLHSVFETLRLSFSCVGSSKKHGESNEKTSNETTEVSPED